MGRRHDFVCGKTLCAQIPPFGYPGSHVPKRVRTNLALIAASAFDYFYLTWRVSCAAEE
ncbi:hypothetical protein ABZ723_19740 [Streptomyces sp. NPDC006700]|uniref:hypothetical protein n=1 Tax=unclassified Streptomyces TaxID=2593676 RepID=UPI0033D3A52E